MAKRKSIMDFFTPQPKKKCSQHAEVDDEIKLMPDEDNAQHENKNKKCFVDRNHSAMDVSFFVNKRLSVQEKLNFMANMWAPDEKFKFPVTTCSGRNRKFLFSWLKTFPWLCYSALEDSAYCSYCVLFAPLCVGKSLSQQTGVLVQKGFRNWKKAPEKFQAHNESEYHQTAVKSGCSFKRVMAGEVVGIDRAIDIARDSQAKQNTEKIRPIIETIILCGRQGLGLRGHRDSGEFNLTSPPPKNEGNFRALLRLRVQSGDKRLIEHFENCAKNATYVSGYFQNEVLAAAHRVIKTKIVKEIQDAKFFSVLADETSDISKVEQCNLCIRYVHRESLGKYKICERFLEFVPVTSTTGASIAAAIENSLQENNLDIRFLRGQGYDGAATMSGAFQGTQALIAAKHPAALYVHCASHSLNLALTSASTVPGIRNCFGTIEKLWCFFNTPKRANILNIHIDDLAPQSRKQKLKQLCPTRWVERHDSVIVMLELLIPVAAALEEISEWEDTETASKASILLNAIKESTFLVALLCSEQLLSFTLKLSKMLQSIESDLVAAVTYAERIVSQIMIIRETADEEFKKLFNTAQDKAEFLGTELRIPRRIRRRNREDDNQTDNPEVYFRRTIFIPFAECLINSIEERLLKHKKILRSFTCLLPKFYTSEINKISERSQREIKENMEKMFLDLAKTYSDDLESTNTSILVAEFKLWHSGSATFKAVTAIDVLNECDEELYPNIHILLKIFATLPVTVSTAERCFSTLRRIKTYLRNTMSEERLNGCASLNIHREVDVTVEEIIRILKESPRRLDFAL